MKMSVAFDVTVSGCGIDVLVLAIAIVCKRGRWRDVMLLIAVDLKEYGVSRMDDDEDGTTRLYHQPQYQTYIFVDKRALSFVL
jgi:hypothetical protein